MVDSKVHWANMGPIWVLPAPGGRHVGPMNLAIWDIICISWWLPRSQNWGCCLFGDYDCHTGAGKLKHIWNIFNTLRPRQNGCHLAGYISKCIFVNENLWTLKKISLKYVPYGLIGNMPALVQIMAWRRTSDKSLSEAMLVCCTNAYMRHSVWMS